jgi:hypothetical protein
VDLPHNYCQYAVPFQTFLCLITIIHEIIRIVKCLWLTELKYSFFYDFFTGLGLQEADLLVGAGPVEPGITLFHPLTGDVEEVRVVHSDGHQITRLAGVQTC